MIAAIKRKSVVKSTRQRVTLVKSVQSLTKTVILFCITFICFHFYSFPDTTLRVSFSLSTLIDFRQMDIFPVVRIGLEKQSYCIGFGVGKSSKSIFSTNGRDVLLDFHIGKRCFESSFVQLEPNFYMSKLFDLGSVSSNYLMGLTTIFGRSNLLFLNSFRSGINIFRIENWVGINVNYQFEVGIRYVF
jgi:hypothetical protein